MRFARFVILLSLLVGTGLTAHAQKATPAPASTAEALSLDTLTVASTTEIDLLAGRGRSAAYLAPDGVHFVYMHDDELCLYEGETEQRCVSLEPVRGIDPESFYWSPDSRYVVFTENFFVLLVDADIWVWDTTTDALQDLTDDGVNRLSLDTDTWKGIDIVPHWLPDGRILFLRYNRLDGAHQPAIIYTIEADGTGLQKLGIIPNSVPFGVFKIDADEQHLWQVNFQPSDTPDNGIWVSDLDGANARQVIHAEREFPTAGIAASPDGQRALVNIANNRIGHSEPANSWMQVVDLETNETTLIDPNRYVMGAGWSPDGSLLAYIVYDPLDEDQSGLYVTDEPGTPGRQLLAGRFNQTTPQLRQTLTWGANNTILLSRLPEQGIVLVHLE